MSLRRATPAVLFFCAPSPPTGTSGSSGWNATHRSHDDPMNELSSRPNVAFAVVKLGRRRAGSGAPGREGRDRDLFAVEFATYF